MSKNERKWAPMHPALERLLERMREQNKDQIDEANKPPQPKQEEVN